MTRKEDLAQITQQLCDRRIELLEEAELEISELRNEFGEYVWETEGDAIDFECDEIAAALADHLYEEILQINHALDRIDQREYGRCEECGCQITMARLEVLPFAANCVPCQAKAEGAEEAYREVISEDLENDGVHLDRYEDFSLPVALKI